MNKSRRRLIYAIVVLFAFGIAVWTYFVRESKQEFLLIWGARANSCVLAIAMPGEKQSDVFVDGNTVDCIYEVASVGDKHWLLRITHAPNRLLLYNVPANGHINIYKTVDLGQLDITSSLQWNGANKFYASGVSNGKEQIYDINIDTNQVTQITYETGMAFEPSLSPNGSKFAYLTYDGAPNRHLVNECFEGCDGYYSVADISGNGRLNLRPFSDQIATALPLSQCELSWAPNNNIVAFRLGCSADAPQRAIVIVDTNKNSAALLIKPPTPILPYISLVGWLSNGAAVYSAPATIVENMPPVPRYFVYSTQDQASHLLLNLPPLTETGKPFEFNDMQWSADHQSVVGVTAADDGHVELVIIESVEHEPRLIVTHQRGSDPFWSPSGNWIAYKSESSLNIIDRNGKEAHIVFDTKDFKMYHFSWYRP